MRITGFMLAVIATAGLLGWYHRYEAVCAGAALIAVAVAWALWRMRSRASDAEADEEAEPNLPREFAMGVLAAVPWLVLASAAIFGLRHSALHRLLVDEPGEQLIRELDVLARNKAWPNILARLAGPPPAHMQPSTLAEVARYHYVALFNSAAAIPDPAARCTAEHEADAFADTHGVDQVTRMPVVCQNDGSQSNTPLGSTIRQSKAQLDQAGRTVLAVAVSDSDGSPVSGLDRDAFVAVSGSQQARIASVTYVPAVLPSRHFYVVVAPGMTPAHRALSERVRAFLAGLVRPSDRLQSIDCAGHDSLPDTLRQAAEHLAGQPGALILLTDGQEPPSPNSSEALLRRLRAAHAPLHIIVLGPRPSRSQLEDVAERSGGGHWRISGDSLPLLRKWLASPIAGEGNYFIVLDGRFNNARVALTSSRPEVSK